MGSRVGDEDWAKPLLYCQRWLGDFGAALWASVSPSMRLRGWSAHSSGYRRQRYLVEVGLGRALSPLWSRMAQKYYEYTHYKERDEQGPQQRPPRGSHAPYLLVFQAIFYSFFHVSATYGAPRGG